ncbi:MAG: 3-oxo-5-alpha-steroid 4-dehydrogenase [Chitinophagaceae bacterium]|nr:3-oxo-5-alpha-steroid 4-dehydrogenase [Chitinophagaceae bacterium]
MLIPFSTYQVIFYVWIGIAVCIFFLLLKVVAPYGRHSSAKWGPLISNHYGWLFMELPALAIMVFFFAKNYSNDKTAIEIMIGLFCLHYFNRTFIFPFRLHTRGKKMPVLIMLSGIFFNLCNTFLLGYYFTHFANYSTAWFTDIRFMGGVILFFTGLWINWKADNILIHLRKPDETDYKIPVGWLFNWVSCPNLMGELIEWAGFALLCWNMPALAFFIWTAANLIPRAMAHHQWYKKKFENYPAERKAVLPYLL